MGTNEELLGIHGEIGRQFAPLSLFPGWLLPSGLEGAHRESLSAVIIPHLVAAAG